MSEDACIFSVLQPTIIAARAVQTKCRGKTEKIALFISGCKQSLVRFIFLLLLRGGIQVDWSDEQRSRSIFEMSVCFKHKTKLFTSWDWNSFGNKRKSKQEITCSLPEVTHDGGKRPKKRRRLNKAETLKFIESTGRFIHVGTAVCKHHEWIISEQNRFISLISVLHVWLQESDPDDIVDDRDMNEDLAYTESIFRLDKEIDENDNQSKSSHPISRVNPIPSVHPQDSEKEKISALREIASLFGLARLTSGSRQIEWKDLKPETQRKKVTCMIHLQNELYKMVAGSGWEEMRRNCLAKYEITGEGGHLSKTPEFWGQLNDLPTTKSVSQSTAEESEEEDDGKKKIYRCTDQACKMKYLTMRGLEEHLLIGKHKKSKHSDTVTEAAAKLFSVSVETSETAYQSMKVDSLSSFSSSNVNTLKLTEGWAVRLKNKKTSIDPTVRRAVRKYFVERRKEGKRAEARWIVHMLRNKTDAVDDSYIFPLKICLKETQAQGLISRFLKVEASKMGLKALESDDEVESREEEEEEEGNVDQIEVLSTPDVESETKKRGRPKKNVLSAEKPKPTRKSKSSTTKKAVEKKPRKQKNPTTDETEEDAPDEEKETGEAGPSTTIEAAVIPPSTRILRSQKRASLEEKMPYCEISSDEDVDSFTLMMNVALKNRKELFTDEE